MFQSDEGAAMEDTAAASAGALQKMEVMNMGNGGPFVDATVHGDGTWSTAEFVGTDAFDLYLPMTIR